MGKLLSGLALAGLMGLAASPAVAQEEKVLNIYNWSDYIAEDTIQNFEKETGIKVRYDTFDNNEILHAKLVAGKTGYDVVVPSSGWARLQMEGGLLRKLDKAQLPNLKNMDPDIQSKIASIDPGNQYLVNWLWGYTTVGINTAKVKAALGAEPMPANVWELFFNPKYVSRLKSCGVSFLDSATEVVPAALHFLGEQVGEACHLLAERRVRLAAGDDRPFDKVFDQADVDRDRAEGEIAEAADAAEEREEEDVERARLPAPRLAGVPLPDRLGGVEQRT